MNLGTLDFPETFLQPTREDSELAATSGRLLAKLRGSSKKKPPKISVCIEPEDGGEHEEHVSIPLSAFKLLMHILTEMAKGNAITFMPVRAELTTQQAADILNVSRPYLISLIKAGDIAYRTVGTHRRIRFDDLMSYKRKTDAASRKAFEALAAQAQELDMGY